MTGLERFGINEPDDAPSISYAEARASYDGRFAEADLKWLEEREAHLMRWFGPGWSGTEQEVECCHIQRELERREDSHDDRWANLYWN